MRICFCFLLFVCFFGFFCLCFFSSCGGCFVCFVYVVGVLWGGGGFEVCVCFVWVGFFFNMVGRVT